MPKSNQMSNNNTCQCTCYDPYITKKGNVSSMLQIILPKMIMIKFMENYNYIEQAPAYIPIYYNSECRFQFMY